MEVISNKNIKVFLKIKNTNRGEKNKVILFEARYNYSRVNFGNNQSITIETYFNDEYIKQIGIGNVENVEYNWNNTSAFLMDCIKYNLKVVSINGEFLEKEINPYSEKYEFEIPSGERIIEVELKKL